MPRRGGGSQIAAMEAQLIVQPQIVLDLIGERVIGLRVRGLAQSPEYFGLCAPSSPPSAPAPWLVRTSERTRQ